MVASPIAGPSDGGNDRARRVGVRVVILREEYKYTRIDEAVAQGE